MKRTLTIVAIVAVVAFAAIWLLRRGPADTASPDDAELAVAGQFLSDSLGVGILLPTSPGWSFERPTMALSGPYMTAKHESDDASLQLFVNVKSAGTVLADVVQQRRDRIASTFRVSDLNSVIEQILIEREDEFDGLPVWRWQALTEPVAMAGEDPAKIMFFIQIVERARHVFEVVGLVRVPLGADPDAMAANAALQNDIGFMLQSVQAR